MAQGAPNYFTAEAMGFILAALFFNTLTAPVVKMTQNAEGGYDYNKWCARGVPLFVSRRRRDSYPGDDLRCSAQVHLLLRRINETRCSARLVLQGLPGE